MVSAPTTPDDVHTLPRPAGSRGKWVTILLGAIILCSGAGLGFGGAMLFLDASDTDTDTEKPTLGKKRNAMGRTAAMGAAYMAKKLDLSAEEKVRVEAALQPHVEAFKKIHRDASALSAAQLELLEADLKTQLTPEQYAKWKKTLERSNKWLREHRRPRGRKSGGKKMWERLDKNNNGSLSADELEGEKIPKEFRQAFSKADLNKDGEVTQEEMKAYWKAIFSRRNRPRGDRSHGERPRGDHRDRPPRNVPPPDAPPPPSDDASAPRPR